jgi:hypothetical protein
MNPISEEVRNVVARGVHPGPQAVLRSLVPRLTIAVNEIELARINS